MVARPRDASGRYDASARSAGLRDFEADAGGGAPTFRQRVERVAARREAFLRDAPKKAAATAGEARDERLLEHRELERRDNLADLAQYCCAVSAKRRPKAFDCLRHPLFDRFAGAPADPAFKGAAALHEALHAHCGDRLDAGAARLGPSDYRPFPRRRLSVFRAAPRRRRDDPRPQARGSRRT